MAQAIALGENRKKVVNRISNVVNEAHYNAARTAQTESTRIRSQARFEAVQEAEEMGLECERVWHCRYNHTRESHLAMEGQTVRGTDEPFISGLGNSLRYPGDPLAPAADVINCYCYVQDRVVSGSQTLARIRQDNAAKRAAWVAQMTDKNNPAANRWRDV